MLLSRRLSLLSSQGLGWLRCIVDLVNLHGTLNSIQELSFYTKITYITACHLGLCLGWHLGLLHLRVGDLLSCRHSYVSLGSDGLLLHLRLLLELRRIICQCLSHLLVLLKALILRKLHILHRLCTKWVLSHLLRLCIVSSNLLEVLLHAC